MSATTSHYGRALFNHLGLTVCWSRVRISRVKHETWKKDSSFFVRYHRGSFFIICARLEPFSWFEPRARVAHQTGFPLARCVSLCYARPIMAGSSHELWWELSLTTAAPAHFLHTRFLSLRLPSIGALFAASCIRKNFNFFEKYLKWAKSIKMFASHFNFAFSVCATTATLRWRKTIC